MLVAEIVNEYALDSWQWSFGDGNGASNSSPVHTYETGGNYEVSLVVTNLYGQDSESHTEIIQLQASMAGDINNDSMVNILDIVLVVNFVLGSDSATDSEFAAADLNNDGILNILDIVTITNLILEG